jgi:hypothetical protein
MREFKFFRGIIRDELIDLLSEEIRQEIDNEIIRNLTETFPFPLTGSGTITTTGGNFTLTTTNTGTADYYIPPTSTNIANTNYTTTASDNLRYLNHYINMEGGNRA